MSANVAQWGPTVPTDILEVQAAEQRRKIHDSVLELRSQMHDVFDLRRQAQQYLVPASAVAAGLGLLLGFGMAGMFSRPRARG
jgi:hypothetical protein